VAGLREQRDGPADQADNELRGGYDKICQQRDRDAEFAPTALAGSEAASE
jgi:hypothetical protein